MGRLDRFTANLPWNRTQKQANAVAGKLALSKALDAVMGAIAQDEQLSKAFAQQGMRPSGGPGGVSGVLPGNSWSNTGGPGVQNRLLARVTQNLSQAFGTPMPELEQALANQGLSWGPPFPPGRPLDPYWGYRRPPRTRDFQVGENVQIQPRWGRISFQTIKALWDAYDVAQICTKHLINDVRSLDYHFEAALGVRDDVSEDIKKAREFFDSPDKRQPFRSWLAEYLIDVIRYDAGCLYVRRNQKGDPIALEVINGATILPIIDYFGRPATDEDDTDPSLTAAGTFSGTVTPAFVQVIQGMPWDWLASDDMIYQPLNPQPDSQYGLAPLEAVLLTANTDIRFQWHFLQYFTEGTVPAGFMEAPESLSDPGQIAEWQAVWDALMEGDQAKLRQIRWVPFGAKYTPIGPNAQDFNQEFPLYLMRRTCAAHGVTPADLGFTETVNKATSEVQVDVQFRVGTLPIVRHVEDVISLFMQTALKLRLRLKFDVGREVEDRLSIAQSEAIYIKHGVISPDEPRARLGYPISMTRPTPRYIDNTRSGPIPLMALESLAGEIDPETFGPSRDAEFLEHPFVEVPGVMPPTGSKAFHDAANTTGAIQENMVASAARRNGANKPGDKKTGKDEPVSDQATVAMQREGENDTIGQPTPKKDAKPAQGKPGKPGSAAAGPAPDPHEHAELTPGETPHPDDETSTQVGIPNDKGGPGKGKPRQSKGKAKKSKLTFGAGIAVVALDTGRCLMLQRSNADESKKSAGKWEFPGGIPEGAESHWDAAKREWEEETGNRLPEKGVVTDTWQTDKYTLFIYLVKFEGDVLLNPDKDDMRVTDPDHPNAFQTEVMAWWEPESAEDGGKAIRKDLRDFDWGLIRDAKNKTIEKEGGPAGGAGAAAIGGAPTTQGITAETGMHGVDLVEEDDDEEETVAKEAEILRQWRDNARNRLRKGLAPRRFLDVELSEETQQRVWSALSKATTREEIDNAFRGESNG